MGRVRRAGRLLKPGKRDFGYGYHPLRVTLCSDGKRWDVKIARLVLLAFRGPPPKGMFVRHLDDDQAKNRLINLEWGTAAQNGRDQVANGRSPRGSRNGNARLTEADVRAIRRRVDPRYTVAHNARMIARQLDLKVYCVSAIIRGSRWQHVR